MTPNEILPDSEIRIHIPRKHLIKLYYSKKWLDLGEYNEVRDKLAGVELNINKLLHVKSVLEKIMLRALEGNGGKFRVD